MTKEEISEYNKKYYQENKERGKVIRKEWYIKNKNKARELNKKWKEANKERNMEKELARGKKWRETNRDKIKNNDYIRRYNITLNDYNNMLIKQNNKCLVCGCDFLTGKPVVDHCHETKIVRGVIHSSCNIFIGYYERYRHITIESIIKYIDQHRA